MNRNVSKYPFLLVFLILAISCSNTEQSITFGDGDDVIVTLNIENNENIEEIEFFSEVDFQSISKAEIASFKSFIYGFDNKGEGTFKICIYKLNDTICRESYVEQGYTPELIFKNDSLIFINYGIGPY